MNLDEIEARQRARIELALSLLNDGAELDRELKSSLKTSRAPAAVSRKRKRLRRILDNLVRSI